MSLLLGYVDYSTGYEISFSIFYLVPVSFVTLFSNFRLGFVVSILCAFMWFFAEKYSGNTYSNGTIPYWNAFMRFGYFSLHTYILSVLVALLQKTQELSLEDSLTGIPNWRYFEQYSAMELHKAKRKNSFLTICYIDLDNFKNINDTLGHDIGNDLLQLAAKSIKNNIRPSDIVARIGGDEFVMLLTEMDYKNGNRILLRIKDIINGEMKTNNWPVTISMGAITFRKVPLSVDTMVKQADKLMYIVKKEGKNNLKHEHEENS